MKIKALLLTLVVIFNIFLVTVCGEKNREYDEGEVKEAALLLIPESEKLNELYYGAGISYSDNLSESEGRYFMADIISCRYFGVETVEDIRNKTRACFSEEYANIIMGTKLATVTDDNGVPMSYVRYYQKKSVLDGTDECIMVDKNAAVLLKDEISYDYSSLRISHSEGQEVIAYLNVTVTNSDGKSQTKEISIRFIEESDGWRINSPTYTTYFDRTDYDNMQE